MLKDLPSVEDISARLSPLFKDGSLQFIILFGSAASGHTHKGSDIDLAFRFDSPMNLLALTNKVITLLHTDKVDLVDLAHASPILKYSVVKSGKLIYEREPGMINEFYSLAFRMYVDTKKLREARKQGIRIFLESRGLA